MDHDRPSTTAKRVALRRAAHQLLDSPTVFHDPLALRILGLDTALEMQNDPGRYETSRISPYLRAFVAARSRYAEDQLAFAVSRGVSQYVILGAGFDTFAYRNAYSKDMLHVFEVDHHSTQSWKQEILKETGISIPSNLTFVPVDFNTQNLDERLQNAGFDSGKSTFFSWLGVTEYLTVDSVLATLDLVASLPAGSEIVFDYMVPRPLLTPVQRSVFDAIAQRVSAAGEPWQTCFDPELLGADLRKLGFTSVVDNGPEQINARYFANRTDGLRVGGLSRIVSARV